MGYQPTGKPAGRPRKDGLPPGSNKPAAKPPEPRPPVVADHPVNAPAGTHKPGPFRICAECWPGGWPKGWTATSCAHGVWARPWVP